MSVVGFIDTWTIASLSLIALLLCTFAIMAVRLYRLQRHHDARLYQLSHDLRLLSGGNIGFSDRLVDMEAKIRELMLRQDSLEHYDNEKVTYQHAAQLLSKGASFAEIEQSCQLSRAEIELIWSMHHQDEMQNPSNLVEIVHSTNKRRQ